MGLEDLPIGDKDKDEVSKEVEPIIDALITGNPKNLAAEEGKFVVNPLIKDPKTKRRQISSLEKHGYKLITEMPVGSVAELVCYLLVAEYKGEDIYIKTIPESRMTKVFTNSQKGFDLLNSILSNPAILILEMDAPDVNYKEGIELEKEKESPLPQGATLRAYVRFLAKEIETLEGMTIADKETLKKNKKKIKNYKRDLNAYLELRTPPMSNEEVLEIVTPIVKRAIEAIREEEE